jgi:DNA-binding NtrC family response regulator
MFARSWHAVCFKKRTEAKVRAENLVLLVEGDASLKRSLEKFLDQAGYSFQSTSTAAQALVVAQAAPPDVVIVEYHLPDSNACAFIHKLNVLAPEAVVILLSEYDFQAIAKDLCRVEIGTFLKKPFDLVDFENSLCSACARKQAEMLGG